MSEIGEIKQYVPIFVGSTFEDLQEYRRVVREALAQLETIVRGMEYFDSMPGSPIDECLAVVRSCRVYIGVIAMCYGSIPDGQTKSMTHLEYDEAQTQKLPSLIYIINEEEQPLLTKYVETGAGAEILKAFKEELRKRHVVSMFTTPQELALKIMHDVPVVLRKIGAKVEGDLESAEELGTEEILRRFKIIPKLLRGKEVDIKFTVKTVTAVSVEEATALGLGVGSSIEIRCDLEGSQNLDVFAEGELAEELVSLSEGQIVRATAATVYGTREGEEWIGDGTISKTYQHHGLKIVPFEVSKSRRTMNRRARVGRHRPTCGCS